MCVCGVCMSACVWHMQCVCRCMHVHESVCSVFVHAYVYVSMYMCMWCVGAMEVHISPQSSISRWHHMGGSPRVNVAGEVVKLQGMLPPARLVRAVNTGSETALMPRFSLFS